MTSALASIKTGGVIVTSNFGNTENKQVVYLNKISQGPECKSVPYAIYTKNQTAHKQLKHTDRDRQTDRYSYIR